MIIVLALRGAAAIAVLTTLVGGIPRLVGAALAVTLGLWTALVVLPVAGLATGAALDVATWQLAVHELTIGAALGVMAAVPLLAATAAGRLVDIAGGAPGRGPYERLFGVLAAAVFVGIDGHVAVIRAIVDSHRALPALGDARASVLGAIALLVPAAVRLAIPWLVTAAIVQLAVGAGVRAAGRAQPHVPATAAVPAALVMITASLIATLAIAIAALVRGAL